MRGSDELKRSAEILIDNGASEHVVCGSFFLSNVRQVAAINVELANGANASSTLRGHIGIDTGRARVMVRNVYYIPDMSLNFLSCSRLDEKGVTTTIAQRRCIFSDRRDNDTFAVLSRRETDDLFVMKISPATTMKTVNTAAIMANDD